MKFLLITAIAVSFATDARAAEGMWTLDHPPLQQMQKDLGWAPDARWLDHAMHGSARLANGCSASFVSANGLVLTNHHCVATCAAQLSTPAADLLEAGFLADDAASERRCPAMEVDRLDSIGDVTREIGAATRGLEGTSYTRARNAAMARLTSACVGNAGRKVRCDVVDLYHGGQYKLYRYRRFEDVRLAFAPEHAVAAFGGDPDNFNFPRYDLDMALLRIYEDDRPVPVVDFFPLSVSGPAAGEDVFVTGHPGTTQRDLTVAQLALLRERTKIVSALMVAEWRGLLTEYRRTGAEAARTAANELNGLENYLKVLRGQLEALLDPALFTKKAAAEATLRRYVAAHPRLAATAGDAWDAIARATERQRELADPYAQFEQGDAFNNAYYDLARRLVRAAAERVKPDEDRLPEFNDSALPQMEARAFSTAPLYPDLEKLNLTFGLTKMRERLGTDDPIVQRILGKDSPAQLADRLIGGTRLGDPAIRRALWEGGSAAIAASDDPFIRLAIMIDPDARALRTRYERDVESVIQKNTEAIARARFEALGDTIYPDATFTLRLSYGKVEGWKEAGRPIPPFTQFRGAFDRATGAPPYALPASWLAKQDALDPSTPLNLVTTHDVVGGNSGSPMLNRRGELVGLIFDGNIHSIGGTYAYDPALNRAVAVDSAAILEALDKVYGAARLVGELRAH